MTKQKFKQTIQELNDTFMNIVFKDGSEMKISNEQLSGTDKDIARGYYYIVNYDSNSYEDQEFEIKISDIAEIIPVEYEDDDEEWEDEYDDDEDWDDDDDDEDWDDDDDDEDWDDDEDYED